MASNSTDDARAPPAAPSAATSKPTKKGKGKGKGKGKQNTKDNVSHLCFQCGSKARMNCSQCHLAWYCGRDCQKVHWKRGHKRARTAAVAAEARRMTAVRKAREAREGGGALNEQCVICMGPVVEPVEVRLAGPGRTT